MNEQCKNYSIIVDDPPKKIIFLDDEKIGKTTFIQNYCKHLDNIFGGETKHGKFLIFDQFFTYVPSYENKVPVRLLDLPSGTTFESRRDQYPAQVNLVVFCFAVDDPESFAHIQTVWIPEFSRYYGPRTRKYLLGLKSEMRTGSFPGKEVSMQNSMNFRIENGFCGEYTEVSTETSPDRAYSVMTALVEESHTYSAELPIRPQD